MEKERRTGIIDTLSAAYGLVNRWPLLLAPPVLLDLFFWFGPRLSVAGPLQAFTDLVARQEGANQEMVDVLRQSAAQSDLLGLLAVQLPSMMRLLGAGQFGNRPEIVITDAGAASMIGLLVLLIGFLASMVFLVPIARVVRDGRPGWPAIARPVVWAWLRLIGLIALLIVAGLAIIIPLSIVTALLSLAGVPLLSFLLILVQLSVVWLVVYLFFAENAIALSEVGPLRAVRYSVMVVRHNFWSSLGLIVLTLVISLGLPEVFRLIARSPIGVPVAIVANAYINTGLYAASLLFYRDRLARWQQQQRATALSGVGPGAPR